MQNKKEKKLPVENHNTAAWADIETSDEISNVPRPSQNQTANAKDYVDENEK